MGTYAIEMTPRSLFGITLSKLKVGKKYHSGQISKGFAKGSAFSPKGVGSRIPKPIQKEMVPRLPIENT